jgi:hypothetical protein
MEARVVVIALSVRCELAGVKELITAGLAYGIR